ncbi:MAG: divalent metal cation transporter [Chitinophagales bacterium]|nr:divalent metal cation transporter [Chitinophagales bacterium]
MLHRLNLRSFIKTLGPGILFASTAIGVSHLVQSTRAGANFGFALLWAIVIANLLKYPFFEYGSRYANVKGKSIIDGYLSIGKWMLILYFCITLGSMFFVTAAVGFVTAGFMENLFGLDRFFDFNLATTSILFSLCFIVLVIGKYNTLDLLIKVIGGLLLFSTVIAFFLTLAHGPIEKVDSFTSEGIWTTAGFAFLIALMGWMPTAVDLSAWNSLWTIERIKQSGYKPSLKETLFEFNLAYAISAALSICFLTLGAFLIFGSATSMPEGSASFANKVIELYTHTIGNWSYFIIAIAAFSIMLGTSIGVFDGYSRALERTSQLLFFGGKSENKRIKDRRLYIISLLVIVAGSYWIISYFADKPKGFKSLVDIATTISFLISPIIAFVNFRLVMNKDFEKEARPGKRMIILSWIGIIFLTIFSLIYLIFLLNKFV